MALSNKQRRFIDEYLKDFNATQAAIRAGYSEKTAYNIGWENVRKREIAEVIERRLQESAMGADEALMHLAELARQEVGPASFFKKEKINTFNEKGFAVEVERLGLDWDKLNKYPHLVKSISFTANGPKVEMYDRLKPLELIGRNQGVFNDPGASEDKPLHLDIGLDKILKEVYGDNKSD